MVRFTLLEVNLDGAQFTANAPFSGRDASEAGEGVGTSLSERLERGSASSESGRSPRALLLGLVALAGFAAVARKLRSRRRSERTQATAEEPIVAG